MGLTLGKSTDYRDIHNASLLQDVPRSPNRDLLGLKADNLPFYDTGIWTLYELSWLNAKGLPQAAVGHAEPDCTSVNLTRSESFKLYFSSFDQTRFNNWDEVRQTLKRDLSTCTQSKVSVALYRFNELGGRPVDHFNGTCTDDQDITIDNYGSTTDYLESATSGEKVAEETLVSHLSKSNYLITRQPDWGSIQIQYRGCQIDREKLLYYLVSFRHHNELRGQHVEHILNDLSRFCQPEKLNVYARYTRRDGLSINPWRGNNDFVPSATRLARQ